MKTILKLLALSITLVACGSNDTTSNTAAVSSKSFSTIYDNNTDKDFDVKVSHAALTVTKSYLHIPTNNLYGNRYIILDFKIKNEAFDKKISTAFDGKWIDASWADAPSTGPTTGRSYVRYLSSEAGIDSFSLIIHDIIYNQSPTVELKVTQGGKDSYSKIQLRAKDLQPIHDVSFHVNEQKDEVAIEKISALKTANGTLLKIDTDVKDLDNRKLFQIECFDCNGGDAAKKTLSFITAVEARNMNGAVFKSEAAGREKISLYVLFPNTSLLAVSTLRLTYLAPGYIGTPTHGAYDGVFGTPHALTVNLSN